MTTSRRGLPLSHPRFYPKLPAGVRQKAVASSPSGNAVWPVLLDMGGKVQIPLANLRSDERGGLGI